MKTVIGASEYRLSTTLGRGGMGEVWKATDARASRKVAVKVLSAPHLADEQFEAAVRREVQAMATLEHPNVVLVHDYGRVDEGSFIVMELANESLGHIIARRPLKWTEIADVLESVLDALAHAHGRGLIHRDIKPDNVLAFHNGEQTVWKLTDFGISHTIDPEHASVHEFAVGTPEFMPPEQFGGQWREYGPSTDLYAVGCLAWMLATGHPPFPGKTLLQLAQQHMYEEPGAFTATTALPPGFEPFVRRLLQKPPCDRYSFAADALQALRECQEESLYGLERSSAELSQFQRHSGAGYTSSARMAETMMLATRGRRDLELRPSLTMRERRADVPPMPLTWERPFKRRSLPTSPNLFGLRTIPFIGREREIDLIWSSLHDLYHGGKSRGFLVEGPTGTGKSRLVEAVCERALEVGCARVFKVEHDQRSQYDRTVLEALKLYLRCNGLEDDKTERRLRDMFAEGDGLPEWAISALTRAFSNDIDETNSGGSQQLGEAIVEVFQRWTDERPLIVWLDDWHWADGSAALVRNIAAVGLPILWLATVQTDALIERGGTPLSLAWFWKDAEKLDLRPLSNSEIERLLGRLLNLDAGLLRKLATSVQGNPLFAVQMVGNWVERGLLVDDAGKFGLARGATLEPPDDLHSAWTNRINRILAGKHAPDGEALEVAAVMGGDIDERVWLRACYFSGIRPSAVLMEEMIEQRLATRDERGWSFVHGMLRASLERRCREAGRLEQAHSAVADALLEMERTPAPAMLTRIGRHLAEAGRYEEALGPLFGGARRLSLRGELAGAEAAITLYMRVAEKANVHPRHLVLGEIEQAEIMALRSDASAREVLEKARITATELREWALLVRAYFVKSQIEGLDARYRDARDAMEAAFDLARSQGVMITPEMKLHHADMLAFSGHIDNSEQFYREAEDAFRKRGDDEGRAGCEFGMGWIALVRGDYARAEAILRASMRRFAAAGNRAREREVSAALADTLRMAGRLEQARRIYLDLLGHGRSDRTRVKGSRYLSLALIEIALGDLDAAESWVKRVDKHWDDFDARGRFFARVVRILVATHRDRWVEFDTFWDGLAEEFYRLQTVDFDVVDSLERAGYIAAQKGQGRRALGLLEVLEPAWTRLGQHDRHRNYLVKLSAVAPA